MAFSTAAQVYGNNTASGTTVAQSNPSAIPAHSLLIVPYLGHSATSPATCADTAGNTYTRTEDATGIPSSTKHWSWFYCLDSVASLSGANTTTVTASDTGTQYIQPLVYAWPGGIVGTYDSTLAANSTGSGTAYSVATAASLSVSGELLVAMLGEWHESNYTFSSPTGTLLFDGSGNSAGQAAGSMTLGVQEFLTAPSGSAKTLGLTISVSDSAFIDVIGFKPGVAAAAASGGPVAIAPSSTGPMVLRRVGRERYRYQAPTGPQGPDAPIMSTAVTAGAQAATVWFYAPPNYANENIISYTVTASPGGQTGAVYP